MTKILITGGESRFATSLKKVLFGKNIFYMKKNDFNILKYQSLQRVIYKIKPKIIIHLAALSRPTVIHEENINKSIDINIIGTANIVKLCATNNIKLIHFSTHYVYPCVKGNYKESDALLPGNNYSWSKLGAECAVQMYLKNSLILRIAMHQTPFIHKFAYTNIKSNFLSHEEVAQILPKIIYEKGILNIGGKVCSIYKFAKKSKKNVKPSIYDKKLKTIPKNSSLDIHQLNKIIKNVE
jgi:dTDP-4-dehydrorhamnose reductase